MPFAEKTTVPIHRSIEKIIATLNRYGVKQHAYGVATEYGHFEFSLEHRRVRIHLPYPLISEKRFQLTPTGKERDPGVIRKDWERACRQRWRALDLYTHGVLEAIESGIQTVDTGFFAYIVLPNNKTVYENAGGQVLESLKTGRSLSLGRGTS